MKNRVIVIIYDSLVTKELGEEIFIKSTNDFNILNIKISPDTNSRNKIKETIHQAGFNEERDYFSFLILVRSHSLFSESRSFARTIKNKDITRLELPEKSLKIPKSELIKISKVVRNADYLKQEKISDDFFSKLEECIPYKITIFSGSNYKLYIEDNASLFDLSGTIKNNDERILPGGEIAYTGSNINGEFLVSTGLLVSPSSKSGVNLAKRINKLSKEIPNDPLKFSIHDGIVENITSVGQLANKLKSIISIKSYKEIVEVGFSFNHAVEEFIHDWPASFNEGYPGVHIGIGRDPVSYDALLEKSIHLDLISKDSKILVNNKNVCLHREDT